ncbi:uncharacterized protein LOC129595661 isoform X2 [Paramacrobiotus metropolitanus]|uniref:uncharacterized protein LOC129595661 isoform X2 n=1 Tax=Paramacrobiotus metropolitanus TaxID=2943436 RepID=UPI0024464A05|nr:uncharacterized protein LOC129595661 isoform X2 [Paramacrobiotus metropolitanus]
MKCFYSKWIRTSFHGTSLWHEVEEMSITELPLPVMVSVLLYLDVDSQWRTSRVCALWRILFRQDVNQRHIVFDLCTVCEIKPYSVPDKDIHALHGIDYDTVRDYAAYLTYKVAVMLDRVSPTRTQTLALTEEGNHFHFYFDLAQRMTLTATVLFRNGVRLPLIIVRNGRDATLEWESWDAYLRETDCFLFVYMCHSGSLVCAGLPELMTVCEQLVLINFTVMHLPTQAAAWILRHDPASELPVSERALMRSEYSGVLRCPVIIPCVRFRSVESADEQARNLLATVNAHWPAVSQRVYKKVTAMHARWVRTLDYPDQWTGIRIFLQMFNPHCPDTTSQRWDSMDLRQLDIAGLNNITFAALDGLFRE